MTPPLLAAAAPKPGLEAIDWALIALYACSTIALGVYFARKQKSTEEYFVGSGNMNPMLIGVSLFATLLSTISYLSMPGEAAGKGPVGLVAMLAYPVTFVIVAYWILPVYMRQRVTSAYELLEERLGLSIRLLGASMFLVLRLMWMTLLVYAAAKAMTVMIEADYWVIDFAGLSVESVRFSDANAAELPGFFRWGDSELRVAAIPVIVIFTGIVALIYTSLGGLQAVVVTDLMQTVLLFGGALLVLVIVTIDFGGFGWFPTQWKSNWDTQPFFCIDPDTGAFDPKIRATVVGTILTGLIWYVCTSAGDQTSVQRFMATRDATAARRALAMQLGVAATVGITLHVVGFALLSYFKEHPGQLAAGMNVKDHADHLFPRFISHVLPAGVAGLVVAAMFAAAMSSIDSGVNSITAVVMTDFLDRFGLSPKTEKGHVLSARLLAVSIGLVVVAGSSLMKYIDGNITAVTNKTVNLLTTPIFGLFFFALFVPFARPLGVWIGALCGTATAALIAFSGPFVYLLHRVFEVSPAVFNVVVITKTDQATRSTWFTCEDPISFQWIGPIALAVNLLTGTAACWLLSRKDNGPKADDDHG